MKAKKLNRRDFLRISALTAAGAALAACGPTPTQPPAPEPTQKPTEVPPTEAAQVQPTATPVPPTEAPVLTVKERLEAIGFLPGAPDHERGWETELPLVATPPDAEPIVVTGNKRVEVGDELVSDETETSPFWQISMELFNIDWQVAWMATAGDMSTKYNLAMARLYLVLISPAVAIHATCQSMLNSSILICQKGLVSVSSLTSSSPTSTRLLPVTTIGSASGGVATRGSSVSHPRS